MTQFKEEVVPSTAARLPQQANLCAVKISRTSDKNIFTFSLFNLLVQEIQDIQAGDTVHP